MMKHRKTLGVIPQLELKHVITPKREANKGIIIIHTEMGANTIEEIMEFIKNNNDEQHFYNEDGLYFLMVFHEGKPFSRYNLEITDGNFIYLGYQMSAYRSAAYAVVCRLGFYATQDFIDTQILNREIMGDKIQFYGVAQAVSFKFNTHPFRFHDGLSACR